MLEDMLLVAFNEATKSISESVLKFWNLPAIILACQRYFNMNYPKDFECLIDSFRRLPGVGYKSAERMAYHVLNLKQEYINLFIEALSNIKKLEKCQICGNLSQDSECLICKDKSRNKNVICVVQNIKDLYAIEKKQFF